MGNSSVTSASNLQMDYMNLLITQLQNQNPLEPMDNGDMATQLTMYSQLSLVEGISSNFDDSLAIAEKQYADSLIGKTVTFYVQNKDGTYTKNQGVVNAVYYDSENKENKLIVTDSKKQEYTLTTDGIVLVEDTPTTDASTTTNTNTNSNTNTNTK
jgi:flagellar basal-body rod modification protein FlgD